MSNDNKDWIDDSPKVAATLQKATPQETPPTAADAPAGSHELPENLQHLLLMSVDSGDFDTIKTHIESGSAIPITVETAERYRVLEEDKNAYEQVMRALISSIKPLLDNPDKLLKYFSPGKGKSILQAINMREIIMDLASGQLANAFGNMIDPKPMESLDMPQVSAALLRSGFEAGPFIEFAQKIGLFEATSNKA